ncbi:indolepyruvate ferredoxin oxidoreductase family protein [Mongoliimonas terrestris]|uniref:indolepyruvate ferredoxin oxidoreductase family protein n=1 Tax=Mongoliimonas terrestris TaxID=1709001 RepID=UPI0009497BD6|nr:indolepyruvate ferredoxin oxidoreductase family protein [Mongoliimonas terrestris]
MADGSGPRRPSLDDKYDLSEDRVFVSGAQAIVRLCLAQKEMDRRRGLNTAGFVTGYPGSPLGGIDGQFRRAKTHLAENDIVFSLGINEELAATAVWGTQQAELRGEGRFDGVFGLWYGKGPGVDRCGDVFRHANFAGTSRHGGVLALMGDDHNAESSSTAHQSEFHFVDLMIPILHPAGVHELIEYGLYGWAMSRYTGTWVAMKGVKDNIESTGSIDGSFAGLAIRTPDDFALPPGGLNIRLGDTPLAQEARVHDLKRDAILAFVKANGLNRTVTTGGRDPVLGILTVGKSYLDTLQALEELGLDLEGADALGIRILKVACPWPLSRAELARFAEGLHLVMVVEEKRSLIEVQFREELFGLPAMPVCIGKKDEAGEWLFPVKGALDPNAIAIALGERLQRLRPTERIAARLNRLKAVEARAGATPDIGQRVPHFCSGCPHNTSTVVPEGARGIAGIGCHYMVQWMERGTEGITAMGGEGASWIGESLFSRRRHVFQNLGDGTFNHSGVQAVRAAVAAGTTITFKILYNDAVAMTGGQAHEGNLTADALARQVAALGVRRLVVVADDPAKYPAGIRWPAHTEIRPRDDLMAVQGELAEIDGVTILLYDQTCAAEKRRRRKRGTYPDPKVRVFINERVCEGCGDCGTQSNCVSIQPRETAFGRKRQIDQSSCNKDYSCLKGFCPSFVTVENAEPRKHAGSGAGSDLDALVAALPAPAVVDPAGTWNVVMTGIGGTGIVTAGAVLGMAAHIEGKGVGIIDMAGLAQKGGAVVSHLRFARTPDAIKAIRVSAGAADLVLGFDIVVAGSRKILAAADAGRTHFLVNTHEVMPGDFTRNPDHALPIGRIRDAIEGTARTTRFLDATAVATSLLGTSIEANVLMLGVAAQMGLLPVSPGSIEQAIAMNGEAVAANVAAFRWGRLIAHDPSALPLPVAEETDPREAETLDDLVEARAAFLAAYQNAAWADRYRRRIAALRQVEGARTGGERLSREAAKSLFKLMAYKDEYEVARLFADGAFLKSLDHTFERGPASRIRFHLSPPLLARTDPATGRPRKMTFGPWMLPVFRLLAKGRVLRSTALDPFGWTAERRHERAMIAAFEADLALIESRLTPETLDAAVDLAALPQSVRGFGPVKRANADRAERRHAELVGRLTRSDAPVRVAAE